MELNENILKLTGSAFIESPLEVGKKYAVGVEIAIPKGGQMVDNEDGTYDLEFTGKLVRAEIKTETGVIRTKDKSKTSQKNKAWAIKFAQEHEVGMSPEGFYDYFFGNVRHFGEEVYQLIKSLNKLQ